MELMVNNIRRIVTSKQACPSVLVMETALKDLYKNAEEKLSCACLIYKDMRTVVVNYFRQQKPRLIESEVEKLADTLLKTSYEEYKKERSSTLNVIRRSFRKVGRKRSSCGCGNNKANFITKLTRKNANYKELEESVDEANCNCHVTCTAQYEPDNFLRPLERFVAVNRSFKLRLKHLDHEKYGYLDTDKPVKKSKPEINTSMKREEDAMLSTPNKSFQVKMEDASTPSRKAPQYRFHFVSKSPLVAEPVLNKSSKHEKMQACCGNTSKKLEAITNDQTFVRASPKEMKIKSREQPDKEIVVKFVHCDNHCFLCTLGNDIKVKPELVYCRNHCPQCVVNLKEDVEVIQPKTVIEEVEREKLPKKRNKSAVRVPKNARSEYDSSQLDDSIERQINWERARGSNDKENYIMNDDILFLEKSMDELNVSFENYLEWDSMGSGLSPGKNGSKRNISWSNTPSVLENIRNNHLKPIKKDIKDMQKYFKVLKDKYKY